MVYERICDAGEYAYGWIPMDTLHSAMRVWFDTSGRGSGVCAVSTQQSTPSVQCEGNARRRAREPVSWYKYWGAVVSV